MKNVRVKIYAFPRRHHDEPIVQSDLAYTPSQMMKLTERGIPVSAATVSEELYFEGVPMSQGSFDLPLDMRRGVDVADCWQASESVRKKAKSGLQRDVQKFGKQPIMPEHHE